MPRQKIKYQTILRKSNRNGHLNHLSPPASLGLEPLEPRNLLAGLPTLIDVVGGAGGSLAREFTNVNNTVFFTANEAVSGRELWKSDGTDVGTVRVKDIQGGANGSNLFSLTNVNGTLFFQRLRCQLNHENK